MPTLKRRRADGTWEFLSGARGAGLLTGAGAPDDALGYDGDLYFDSTNQRIYLAKAAGAWGSYVTIGSGGGGGTAGVDGKTLRSGTGAPSNSLGVDGDFYISTDTHFIYGPKAAGVWPAGVSIVGPAGSATNGTNGNTVLNGTGAPSSGTGANGDFYIDTVASVIYGPKASGAWPGSGTSLVGAAGAAGKTILNGAGAPSSGTGTNGDFYLDTTATVLYGPKASGAWPGSGTSLIGASGSSSGGYPYDIRNYGTPDYTGATTQHTIIQAAMTAAGAQYTSTGRVQTVYLPNGSYKLTTAIAPVNGVRILGETEGGVVLLPYGTICAIQGNGTLVAPITDMTFQNFTIDGTNQTNGGTYSTAQKGIFCQYMLRPRFYSVTIKNVLASGFGVDYLIDYRFDKCTADTAGRGFPAGDTSALGGSGIGIGTGKSDSEYGVISNCTVLNCGNHGIFFEKQSSTTFYSKHSKVIGNHLAGNRVGFADRGVSRLIFSNNVVTGNTAEGILVNQTSLSSDGGAKSTFTGNVITSNGTDGISIIKATAGGHVINLNRIEANSGYGIRIDTAGSTNLGRYTQVDSNGVENNGLAGIYIGHVTGSTIADIFIRRNNVRNNGTVTGNPGIKVDTVDTSRLRILGNTCSDDQGSKTQTYGLQFATGGAHLDMLVEDNDFRNNLTGAMTLGSGPTFTGTTAFNRNVGYNPLGPATITVSASPFTYTAGQTREIVWVSGGTITSITKSAVNIGITSGAIDLAANEAIIVTYSVAPTMVKDRK